MKDNRRSQSFKVRDAKLIDVRFDRLTNEEWGLFHKLECYVNRQPERGVVRLPPQEFRQALANRLNVRPGRLDSCLTRFKARGLLEYSLVEGRLDFEYLKEMQNPMSSAERKRRQRKREASRSGHENVTEGFVNTPPSAAKVSSSKSLPSSRKMLTWLRPIHNTDSSDGYRRVILGEFQTMMARRTETERQEVIRLAAEQGLTIPD